MHPGIPGTHTTIPQSKLDQKLAKRLINLDKKRDCLVQRPSCGSDTGVRGEGGQLILFGRVADA